MAAPLKHKKAVLSWHRGRDGPLLGMGSCRAGAVVMVPVAWGATMGWVGWHRYSGGVGSAGSLPIISGVLSAKLRRRKRGRQADELESKWERECCKTQCLRAEGRARNGGESNSDWLAPLVVREVKGWMRWRIGTNSLFFVFCQQPSVEKYSHPKCLSPAVRNLTSPNQVKPNTQSCFKEPALVPSTLTCTCLSSDQAYIARLTPRLWWWGGGSVWTGEARWWTTLKKGLQREVGKE